MIPITNHQFDGIEDSGKQSALLIVVGIISLQKYKNEFAVQVSLNVRVCPYFQDV